MNWYASSTWQCVILFVSKVLEESFSTHLVFHITEKKKEETLSKKN